MDILEKVIELINESELSQIQKHVGIGKIRNTQVKESNEDFTRNRIISVSNEKKQFTIVLDSPDIIIYKLTNPNPKDDWDRDYPYHGIYMDRDQNWRRHSTVSPSFELAFLNLIATRQLGENDGKSFVSFAAKMLEIEIK